MWLIRVDGFEMESDDFTIEELGEIERVSGDPWSVVNPLRSAKAARAFVAIALLRSGLAKDQVADRLAALNLRDLKTAFDYKPEDAATLVGDQPAPLARRRSTTRGSSRGRPAKDGSRLPPDESASATS